MTAKEQADKIFNQHYFILLDADSDISQEILISSLAKKMALVTIEEIIKEHCHESEHKNAIAQDRWVLFWMQVKQEIEKL